MIRRTLEDDLDYAIDFRVISSAPWVPQKRERIFIAGFRKDVGFSFDGFEKLVPEENRIALVDGKSVTYDYLVIATGPGTELRRPLGITIIGGLLVSQVLTLYTTPVIYLLIDRLRRRSERGRVALPAE